MNPTRTAQPSVGERLRPIWRNHGPVILLIAVALGAALLIGNDFGMTFDEERNVAKGEAALGVYGGDMRYFELDALPDHGTAYFMLFAASSRAFNAVLPGWTLADGRHLTHFLMFLVAVVSFYVLAVRLMTRRAAWLATALFATQPLLFGNGFINQKDTPFMALFMAAMATGVVAIDRWRPPAAVHGLQPLDQLKERLAAFFRGLARDWVDLAPGRRRLMVGVWLLSWLAALDMRFLGGLRALAGQLLGAAYAGQALAPVQFVFDRIATDAYKSPLPLYVDKLDRLFTLLPWLVIAGSLLLSFLLASAWWSRVRLAWGFKWDALRQPWWWVSAILFGLTVCVRQLGLFVAGLLALYMLYRRYLRTVFPMVVYVATGFAVTVATWPYLWPDPIGRFIDSFLLATSFPAHRTFFQGMSRSSAALPWHYYPTLVGIQLTEPAVLLLALGLLLGVLRIVRGRLDQPLLGLLYVWVGVPLAGLVFFDMTVYGNIRHLLFTLPPLLLLAGLALDAALKWTRPGWQVVVLTAAVLLPGIWGIVRLHPFEYVYYNGAIGGVSGAFGSYELDRQCISLRQGVEYVSTIAEAGDTVMLPRQTSQAIPFARPDLQLIDARVPLEQADFVVTCHWPQAGDFSQDGFELVHQIGRGRAALTDIWRRTDEAVSG